MNLWQPIPLTAWQREWAYVYAINFVIKVGFAFVKGYKCFSSMYCIYQVFLLCPCVFKFI